MNIKDEEIQKEITKLGNIYINDIANMNLTQGEATANFINGILTALGYEEADEDELVKIISYPQIKPLYIDIRKIYVKYYHTSNVLRATYKAYRQNALDFERQMLRLSSVLSTTVEIENKIHSILYNKDLLLESSKTTEKEKWEKVVKETTEMLKENQRSMMFIKKRKMVLDNEFYEIMEDTQKTLIELITDAQQHLQDAEAQERKNANFIRAERRKYENIANISKDKNLEILIKMGLECYIKNEIISEFRNTYFKKHNIVIENAVPEDEKIKCERLEAYKVTSQRLAQIITLSMQNYGKNVIKDNILKLFSVVIQIQDGKSPELAKIIRKYAKMELADFERKKDVREAKINYLLADGKDITDKVMQEMGW